MVTPLLIVKTCKYTASMVTVNGTNQPISTPTEQTYQVGLKKSEILKFNF